MCGITGFLQPDGSSTNENPQLVEKMIKTLERRGPDGQKVWTSGNVALAHARLIVLDPKGQLSRYQLIFRRCATHAKNERWSDVHNGL